MGTVTLPRVTGIGNYLPPSFLLHGSEEQPKSRGSKIICPVGRQLADLASNTAT
jgi:hypothetical protein